MRYTTVALSSNCFRDATSEVRAESDLAAWTELEVTPEKMTQFRSNGELELEGGVYHPNEYCALSEKDNPKRTALTRVYVTGTKLVSIETVP